MIVKNGEHGLSRCLASVTGTVDRILIGDTGSSDQSKDIAKLYGAELVDIPWEEDFAKARNQVLSLARCDWILVLDCDEMLDDAGVAALPELIRGCDATISGFDTWRWNYVRELDYRSGGEQALINPKILEEAREYPAYFRTNHTRLFRRNSRIRFNHCVHESVIDSFEAANLHRVRANFLIHHFGYVDDAIDVRKEKSESYHRLAFKKLAAAPETFEAHLEAGIAELEHAKSPAEAIAHLTQATAISPHMHVAWLYRGICLTRLGRFNEALDNLQKAAAIDGSSPLVHSSMRDVYFQLAQYSDARQSYLDSAERGDMSPVSLAKLGAAEVQLGFGEEGLKKVQDAVKENTRSGELLDILATTALLTGNGHIASEAADKRLSLDGVTGYHFLLAATVNKYIGKPSKAEAILHRGLNLFPGDIELRGMLTS